MWTFATFDDRPDAEAGVRLLALSLARHCPEARLRLCCPRDSPLYARLSNVPHPNLALVPLAPPDRLRGWATKPWILLQELEAHDEVFWIDTDIIVTRRFASSLDAQPAEILLVTQDTKWVRPSGWEKAQAWGLEPRQRLPFALNSCFMRVRRRHRPLLGRWRALMESEPFAASQLLPFKQRVPHLRNDQDVLEALLSSAEFADEPFHLVRAGLDIAQCFGTDGYSARDRIGNLFVGLPPMVHAQGSPKPWQSNGPRPVVMDTSPYLFAARAYRHALGSDTSWMFPSSRAHGLLEKASFGHPSVTGLWPILWRDVARTVRVRKWYRGAVSWSRRLLDAITARRHS